MWGLLWEYYATPNGVEVRLFRHLRLWRLRREDIVSAQVIDGALNLAAMGRAGSHPWNTISMGNRWSGRWVLVEKRRWPRFLAMTPRDPDAFVQTLLK